MYPEAARVGYCFQSVVDERLHQEVTLQQDNILEHSILREVCRVVRESGAEGKVLPGTCLTNDIDVLSCKASTEAVIWSRFFPESDRMLEALRYFPSFGHITSLNLEASAS